jgi:hypothetical protein
MMLPPQDVPSLLPGASFKIHEINDSSWTSSCISPCLLLSSFFLYNQVISIIVKPCSVELINLEPGSYMSLI